MVMVMVMVVCSHSKHITLARKDDSLLVSLNLTETVRMYDVIEHISAYVFCGYQPINQSIVTSYIGRLDNFS